VGAGLQQSGEVCLIFLTLCHCVCERECSGAALQFYFLEGHFCKVPAEGVRPRVCAATSSVLKKKNSMRLLRKKTR
jgi:hypothetical protein